MISIVAYFIGFGCGWIIKWVWDTYFKNTQAQIIVPSAYMKEDNQMVEIIDPKDPLDIEL